MADAYAGRSKYDEPGKAAAYRRRSPKRDAEEWRLIERVLDALPNAPADALDVPCGTGRIAEHLIQRGVPTFCGDLSPAMREQVEQRLAGVDGFRGVAEIDLEDADDTHAADLVVSFRFLHHLPDAEHRRRVLASLRNLTKQTLLLSFHHPVSLHNLERTVKGWFTRKTSDRYTLWPGTLREEAAAAGFEVVRCVGLAPYRRELWLGVLVPNESGG